jgi:hypothetical protein
MLPPAKPEREPSAPSAGSVRTPEQEDDWSEALYQIALDEAPCKCAVYAMNLYLKIRTARRTSNASQAEAGKYAGGKTKAFIRLHGQSQTE